MGNIFGYFLGYWVNFGKFVTKTFTISGRIFPFTFTSGENCDLNGKIFTPARWPSIKTQIFVVFLRAGNEKDEDQADTVGCCSLRVEHITLHEEKDGKFSVSYR